MSRKLKSWCIVTRGKSHSLVIQKGKENGKYKQEWIAIPGAYGKGVKEAEDLALPIVMSRRGLDNSKINSKMTFGDYLQNIWLPSTTAISF